MSVQEDMDENMMCAICLDIYTKPLRLPCKHSFCRKCLKEMKKDQTVIICPLCRYNVQLGKKGIKKLEKNMTLIRAIKKAESRHKKGLNAEKRFSAVFAPQNSETTPTSQEHIHSIFYLDAMQTTTWEPVTSTDSVSSQENHAQSTSLQSEIPSHQQLVQFLMQECNDENVADIFKTADDILSSFYGSENTEESPVSQSTTVSSQVADERVIASAPPLQDTLPRYSHSKDPPPGYSQQPDSQLPDSTTGHFLPLDPLPRYSLPPDSLPQYTEGPEPPPKPPRRISAPPISPPACTADPPAYIDTRTSLPSDNCDIISMPILTPLNPRNRRRSPPPVPLTRNQISARNPPRLPPKPKPRVPGPNQISPTPSPVPLLRDEESNSPDPTPRTIPSPVPPLAIHEAEEQNGISLVAINETKIPPPIPPSETQEPEDVRLVTIDMSNSCPSILPLETHEPEEHSEVLLLTNNQIEIPPPIPPFKCIEPKDLSEDPLVTNNESKIPPSIPALEQEEQTKVPLVTNNQTKIPPPIPPLETHEPEEQRKVQLRTNNQTTLSPPIPPKRKIHPPKLPSIVGRPPLKLKAQTS